MIGFDRERSLPCLPVVDYVGIGQADLANLITDNISIFCVFHRFPIVA